MTRAEIDRIKSGVIHAIGKSPGNQILRDLERAILTVERYQAALEEIYKREGPGPDGTSENASGRVARVALEWPDGKKITE